MSQKKSIYKSPNVSQLRGRFGVPSRTYKKYVGEGPRTSVGEWSDREPGYSQSVDMRWQETQKGNSPFIGPDERQATQRIKNLTRRSAVTAASRYQWSKGRTSGEEFGRRRAAQYERYQQSDNQPQKVDEIAQF
jgi:hypothetical protein